MTMAAAKRSLSISADHDEFRPDICGLIIGATKCGTTSLYRSLCYHPEICPSDMKELNIFFEDETAPSDYEGYLRHFRPNPLLHRVTLEASPQYSHFPRMKDVPRRIAAIGAPFRLIYIVRDPFERIESHYRNGLGEGFIDHGPAVRLDEMALLASDYSLQLAEFEKFFRREDILVLSFDLLTSSPQLAYAAIFRHLGLRPYPFLPELHENRGENFVHERAKMLAGTSDSTDNSPHSAPAEAVRDARQECRIPADVRRTAHARLAEGMARLNRDYGIDVSAWGFTTAPAPVPDRQDGIDPDPARDEPVCTVTVAPGWRPFASGLAMRGLELPYDEAREWWASGDLKRKKVYGRNALVRPRPKFSIIIATHGRPDRLARLLSKLRRVQEYTPSIEIIVVIDGDKTGAYDRTAWKFRALASFYRLAENAGPAQARNVGTVLASGDFAVFVDDDCQPPDNYLEMLTARLRDYPELAAVGGPTVTNTKGKPGLIEQFTLHAGLNPKPGYHEGRLICLPSCNLAVRRDWFLYLGGFEPALRASEDYNFTYRMKRAGAPMLDDAGWNVGHDQDWKISDILSRAKRNGYWLSEHIRLSGDGEALGFLPRTSLSALWTDIPKSIRWRAQILKGRPISLVKKAAFLGLHTLHVLWLFRGRRRWLKQHGTRSAATPVVSVLPEKAAAAQPNSD